MENPASGGPASNYADGDEPEFVADLILQAIEEGDAQYFAVRPTAAVGRSAVIKLRALIV